jgi:hypothetical protein
LALSTNQEHQRGKGSFFGDFAVELNQSAICLSMAHDVFISHAHQDKNIANAICEKLESVQVKCWVSDRDISAGEDRTETTLNAIGSSHVVVLVLSDNANEAPNVEREIVHAFYTRRTIFPVRLTDTFPRRDYLFYLRNALWIDAFKSPEGQYLEALNASVNGVLQSVAPGGDIMHSYTTPATDRALDDSDSLPSALQASQHPSVEVLKRLSVGVVFFALLWLLWYVYSQWKGGQFSTADNLNQTQATAQLSNQPVPALVQSTPSVESTPSV